MKIKLTSVYVDDQERALRFYTEVLGFVKKADFSNGPFRWLTVASPEDPGGIELQLALNNNPAAKTYQQALFEQSQPADMFSSDDVQADCERMKARGAELTQAPTDVTGSIELPAGTEMVMPGDNIQMTIELIIPIAMEEQLRFAIREGGRTVGAGVVTKILA